MISGHFLLLKTTELLYIGRWYSFCNFVSRNYTFRLKLNG